MAATTTLLGLVTPTQGTLSGTWGDTVNYGITDYVDIAIAGTLSFAGDGAITLANTTGNASGNGFNTTTAQYMVIRITGTQSIVKIITGPSYSKLYMVDHAGATSAVTFKAAGQTGVSIAVGEKAFVYYNGTDYVKVSSSTADGVTTIDFGTTGLTPATATSGAVTVAGTLAVANGGTGVTSSTGSGSNVLSTSPTLVTPILGTPTSGTLTNATGLPLTTGVTGLLPIANGGTATATPAIVAGTNITVSGSWPNQTINATVAGQVYPGAGIANSTGTAWDTSYTTTGTGTVVALATSPTFVTPILGTPTSGTLTNATGLPLTTGVTGTLPVGNGGTGAATLTANNVILGNGTSAPLFVAPSTAGNVLTSNGTTWASTAPAASGITAGQSIAFALIFGL